MSKKIFIIALVILSALGILLWIGLPTRQGFDIEIKNYTDKEITGLIINYEKISKEIEIPPINPKQSFLININPQEDFGENSMKIHYKDATGSILEAFIFGYFEKGYSGEAKVEILSTNEVGKLKLRVTSKIDGLTEVRDY